MAAVLSEPPPESSYLTFRCGVEQETYAIYQNEQLDIGRQLVQELLGIADRSISIHHIRIHCVAYDDEDNRVAPLVYLRVLSRKAVVLWRHDLDGLRTSVHLTKNDGDVLLSCGDHVQLTSRISIDFTAVTRSCPPSLNEVQIAEVQYFSNQYRLTNRVLGIGGQATVYVAVKQSTRKQFACKVQPILAGHEVDGTINLRSSQPVADSQLQKLAREYNLLKHLSHPNIITLEKVFRTSFNIYIFQELITGGDLMSTLDKSGRLDEPRAAIIVRQVLEAVKYLHANNVVHRDIKPENILMTSWRDGTRIVLTDFGQARDTTETEKTTKVSRACRMYSKVGTFGYVAPEMYDRTKRGPQESAGYSSAIDIWSIGCIAAIMLTNEWMFSNNKQPTVSEFRRQLQVLETGSIWKETGHRAKSFVRSCLKINDSLRPTAAECLQLAWFRHPHYEAEFDALYQRSIEDWKPKEHNDQIIEVLNTCECTLSPAETSSHHFPVAPPTLQLTSSEATNSMKNCTRPSGPQENSVACAESIKSFSPVPAPPSLLSIQRLKASQQHYAPTSLSQQLPRPPAVFGKPVKR